MKDHPSPIKANNGLTLLTVIIALIVSVFIGFKSGYTLGKQTGANYNDATNAQHQAFLVTNEVMEHHIIQLPHKEKSEEQHFIVEIYAGKTLLRQNLGSKSLDCSIRPNKNKNPDFDHYEVTGLGIVMFTKSLRFGHVFEQFFRGKSLLIPYDSRKPISIRAPTGYTICYRIWSDPGEVQTALIEQSDS